MNERIKELAMKTDAWCDLNVIGDPKYNIIWEEKFAELIVRECINCCDDIDVIQKHYLKYGIDQELGASQCIEVIKKHFGVEE